MSENKFNIICRVSGTKVRTQIKGYLETNFSEMAQGQEDFRIKIHVDFDPDDIPQRMSMECIPPDGFSRVEVQSIQPKVASAELETIAIYESAPVGYYTVEGKIEHEEYGTEIAKLEGTFFNMKVPKPKLKTCTTEPAVVVRGDKFELKLDLHSSAPQKLKGTITGKLKPSPDASATRVYELEAQKISIKGDKTVAWSLMVPRDEENNGDYYAEMKFDSKEALSEESFENVMKLKREHDLQVLFLNAETPVVSPGDKVKINAGLINNGMEGGKVEVVLEITDPDGNQIEIPAKPIIPKPDKERAIAWEWKIPGAASLGFYQLNLRWKFIKTGVSESIPGDAIELKQVHQLELTTISTDKDYYLSGQDVKISMVLTDSGTRSGKKPLELNYRILSARGKELHSENIKKSIDEDGADLSFSWTIPEGTESGAYDIHTTLSQKDEVLLDRKHSRIINIEQPISLKFSLIQPEVVDEGKMINKYIFEGESVSGKNKYHDLKIIKMSTDTNILVHNKKVLGGLSWQKVDENIQKSAYDLYFSYLMLNKGIKVEQFREMKKNWNDIGDLWSSRLAVSLKELFNGVSTGKSKQFFQLKRKQFDNTQLNDLRTKLGKALGIPSDWRNYARTSLVNVKPNIAKKLIETIKPGDEEPFEQTALGLTWTFLEFNRLSEKNKLALAMKDYLDKMNSNLSGSKTYKKAEIERSLLRWLGSYKNPKIEVDENDEVAWLLDIIYSIAILKLISAMLNLFDYIIPNNKLTRPQFVNLCFYIAAYHLVCIEHIHKNIRYDRFMDETQNKEELNRHIISIEQLATVLEPSLGLVTRLFNNQKVNMELRAGSALLYNSVDLVDDSSVMNGLSGEHVRKQLLLKNRSSKRLKFNLLFAFPSDDWHLLEPEANLIDGVYRRESLSIAPSGKFKQKITVSFPKSLAYQEYTGLIKLEPLVVRLLEE